MTKKAYTDIDYFRFVAAFLVIAIHTSPLVTYSESLDFVLTRIIARTAVPFFFMVSGFFLISRYSCNYDKLIKFVRKTTLIYIISILLYIPLNIYNGYFKMDNLLPNIIKDIIFDGTIYHLWYLPASIIGAVLSWFIVKKAGFKNALLITAVLYVIGLFGDSYYGLVKNLPLLHNFYKYIFQISDYTRNGIFFAPVFFVLGGIIADESHRFSRKENLIGFITSIFLLLGEGMLLHKHGLQRHDSMYIMLLPCMYFLLSGLIQRKGHRTYLLCTSALIIYIIHPLVIVAVRMFAKLFGVQKILIENSLVHYITVSIISATFALSIAYIYHNKKEKSQKTSLQKDRSWVELNYDNLEHNVESLKNALPTECELMAVVKADAYGHGAYEVATHINRIGVRAFAVATIDEGIELRSAGIIGEILILGYTNPARANDLYKYHLMQTVFSPEYADTLNNQNIHIKVHIKIDTGMHRLGFSVNDTECIAQVFSNKNLHVCGMFTHLCVSDSLASKDVCFTYMQISSFYQLLDKLKEKQITLPKVHIQSSYGLLNYPELKCDYVRIGIALYGALDSSGNKTKLQLDLHPVLSLKSQIILLRNIQCGETVGYDRAFVASRDSLIAIIPIGYADGLPRNLSGGSGSIIVRGQQIPIIGRICMDQLAIDVTDVSDISIGDIVTLIGNDSDNELNANTVANCADSIPNELLSRIGKRIGR